jgi:hypothetical protein
MIFVDGKSLCAAREGICDQPLLAVGVNPATLRLPMQNKSQTFRDLPATTAPVTPRCGYFAWNHNVREEGAVRRDRPMPSVALELALAV